MEIGNRLQCPLITSIRDKQFFLFLKQSFNKSLKRGTAYPELRLLGKKGTRKELASINVSCNFRNFALQIFEAIKSLGKIIQWVVGIVLSLYLLILFVINFSLTQRIIANGIQEALSEKLHTTVTIGGINIGLFNRVIIKDLKIKDQSQHPLLGCKLVTAKIEIKPLLWGEISLRTISLLDANIQLYKKTANSPTNFQFIIDALKSKEEKKEAALNLRINSIILRRVNLTWNEWHKAQTPGKINFSHLSVRDISSNISLKRLTPDSINLRVRALAFEERSGLDVEKLTLRLVANHHKAVLTNFDLRLSNSFINQSRIIFTYDDSSTQTLGHTLTCRGIIDQAQLSTEDFAFALPVLKDLKETFSLSTDYSVNNNRLKFNNIRIKNQNKNLTLLASVALNRTKGEINNLALNIRQFSLTQFLGEKLFTHFSHKQMPAILTRIGNVEYSGIARIKFGESYLAKGLLKTSIGNFNEELAYKGKRLSGNIEGKDFALAEMIGKKELPSQITFKLKGEMLLDKQTPEANANINLEKFEYNNYLYHGVASQLKLAKQHFAVNLKSTDPNALLGANIEGNLEKLIPQNIRVIADIHKLTPAALHLTQHFGKASFSTSLKGKLKDMDFKNPVAQLQIRNFNMFNTDSAYQCQQLNISTTTQSLHLRSDFADADIQGPMDLQRVKRCVLHILSKSVQGLKKPTVKGKEDKWAFNVQIKKTDIFRRLLNIRVYTSSITTLRGYINQEGNATSVVFDTKDISYNGLKLKYISLYFNSKEEYSELLLQAKKTFGETDIQMVIDGKTEKGKVLTNVYWDENRNHEIGGSLKFTTKFSNEGKLINIDIHPTNFHIGDSIWDIDKGQLAYMQKSLDIRVFSIRHADQKLNIFGKLSSSPKDSICAELEKIDVAYIMNLVDFHAVDFTGKASGTASLSHGQRGNQLSADLHIPDFYLNDGPLGDLHLLGSFDFPNEQINLDGDIVDGDTARTKVKGYVNLHQKQLQLDINSQKTNLVFLNRYISGIFDNFQGRGTGYCRIFGPLKDLDFEGDVDAWAKAKIQAIGGSYLISNGHVTIQPGIFSFHNFTISDEKGGNGTVNGTLQHTHLKDLRYNFDIEAKQLLVFNLPPNIDLPFYATAYGTGHVALKGFPNNLQIDLNMRPERGTVFTYMVNSPDNFTNVPFIRFGTHKDSTHSFPLLSFEKQEPTKILKDSTESSSTNIRMNMLFDVTPDATIKVIMDEKTSDAITTHGSGPIRVNYYNKGSFNMYGTYTIESGTYKMSIQNIIRKDFSFTQGSKIIFNGAPYQGDLNMQAVYAINSASLADLNIGRNFSTNTTRVNCLLNFRGKVQKPEVNFDLDLPNVNEDEKQMVRRLIATEEDMNMQIIYLLGVGRFYAPNHSQIATNSNETQTGAAMKSFLSSTLSNQFNSIISNVMNTSNWTFSANLSTGSLGTNTMEVEGLLSGRLLNNRLLINGNFGYRDNTYNTTNFVGDFNVQYFLTKRGSLSLKAYSETNDRYFTQSTLTTQGFGILLKRDFNNMGELFRWLKPSRSSQKKKR
ncbi:translocation/assembly module TamB domain-containing protein [Alloprevotella rava]|uniref:translocation/assembly module TamB domain-containing protein n=1 Tax=Alloprevotella rava TaxID=671218 RepID=UPI0018DE9010